MAEPLGIRLNNPLNIRHNKANDWVGQVGADSGFVKFDSPASGVRAADILLKNYQKAGVRTARDVINRFAPPHENDTDHYIGFVAEHTGIDPDTELDLQDPSVRRNLLTAMARMETGYELDASSPPKPRLPQQRDPIVQEALDTAYTVEELEAQFEERYGREQRNIKTELQVLDVEDELEAREEGNPSYVLDVAAGINRGILGAADETSQFFGEIASYLGASDIGEYLQSVDLRGAASEVGIGNTTTVAGDLAAGVSQFLAGFIPTIRAARGAAAAKGTFETAAQYAAAGAIADATVFDPHEARLSNLLRDYAGLNDPVTAYLAADPTDSAAEGRFKNALEGLGLGVLVDGLLVSVKGIRNIRIGKANDEAAEAMIQPRKLEEPEPDIKPDAEPEATPAKAEDPVDPAPKEADTEADIAQPKSFFDKDSFRSRLALDPALRGKLADRIQNGSLNDAEDLIDFNADTIEWDLLDDPAHVRTLINTTSEVLADFIDDAKGGVQTYAQTKKLANLVGGSAEQVSKLYADVRGGNGITARLFAAQKVLTSSADRLRVLARKAASSTATQADELAFYRQVELHGLVQAQVKGAGSEVARALNAMRVLKAADADNFREFDDIIQSVGAGDPKRRQRMADHIAKMRDEAGVNKIVRRSRFGRARDAFIEMYVNGLLSAISTQTLNNISNAMKVMESITENYVASGIGKLRGNADRIKLKEANARMAGTLIGLRRATGIGWSELSKLDMDALAAGFKESPVAKAFREESPQLDYRQRIDTDTRKAISASGEGLDARAINAFGQFIRLPSRMIMTSDEFFKNITYQQELSALAWRKADAAAEARGLTGDKRVKSMERDIASIFKDTPEDIRAQALENARYQTFQADLESQLSRSMENLIHRTPAVKLIVPFFRTPVNIVKQAVLERSPFALASNKFWKTVSAGGPEADIALARLTLGSFAIGTAAMFALDGNLTGSGLNNGSRRNTEALDDIPPYSVRIGDEWYQYNRLEPMGLIMGLSADMLELQALWGDEQMDEANEVAAGVLTTLTTNITDKTWFKGIADMVQFMEDPKRYGPSFVKNLSTTAVTPYSSFLRRSASDFDANAREAWTWMDTLKSKLPGLSATLPPKHDLLGNPVVRRDYLGPAILSPFAVGKEKDDPVYSELARLEMFYDKPDKDLFGLGEDVDAATYSEFMRVRGQHPFPGGTMQERMGDLFNAPIYRNQLSDEGRREMVKKIVSAYTRAARGKMLRDDPALLQRLRESKFDAAAALTQ